MRIAPPGTSDERIEPRRSDDQPGAQRVSGQADRASTVAVVASSVSSLSERASQAAADRAAHVEALRARVASGQFTVDLGTLADRMLDDEGARAARPARPRE